MIHVKSWTSRWVSELNQNQHLQERGSYPQPILTLAAQKLCPCSSSSPWLASLPHPSIVIWISVMTEFTSNKARLSLVKSYQRTHRTPKHYCWHKSDFRLTAENKQKRRRKDKRIRTLCSKSALLPQALFKKMSCVKVYYQIQPLYFLCLLHPCKETTHPRRTTTNKQTKQFRQVFVVLARWCLPWWQNVTEQPRALCLHVYILRLCWTGPHHVGSTTFLVQNAWRLSIFPRNYTKYE